MMVSSEEIFLKKLWQELDPVEGGSFSHIAQIYNKIYKFCENFKNLRHDEVQLLVDCLVKYLECVYYYVQRASTHDLNQNFIKNFCEIINIVCKVCGFEDIHLKSVAVAIFKIVTASPIKIWFGRELLINLNMVLQNCKAELRSTVAAGCKTYLCKLLQISCTCGDYNYQVSIMETVFRLCSAEQINEYAHHFKTLERAFLKICINNFDQDVRTFLNIMNGKFKTVFSIKCQQAFLGNIRITAPKEPEGTDLWVDFNTASKTISILCNMNLKEISSSTNSKTNKSCWDCITVNVADVNDILLSRFTTENDAIIIMKLKPPYVVLNPSSQESMHVKQLKLKFLTSSELHRFANYTLSTMFHEKFKRPVRSVSCPDFSHSTLFGTKQRSLILPIIKQPRMFNMENNLQQSPYKISSKIPVPNNNFWKLMSPKVKEPNDLTERKFTENEKNCDEIKQPQQLKIVSKYNEGNRSPHNYSSNQNINMQKETLHKKHRVNTKIVQNNNDNRSKPYDTYLQDLNNRKYKTKKAICVVNTSIEDIKRTALHLASINKVHSLKENTISLTEIMPKLNINAKNVNTKSPKNAAVVNYSGRNLSYNVKKQEVNSNTNSKIYFQNTQQILHQNISDVETSAASTQGETVLSVLPHTPAKLLASTSGTSKGVNCSNNFKEKGANACVNSEKTAMPNKKLKGRKLFNPNDISHLQKSEAIAVEENISKMPKVAQKKAVPSKNQPLYNVNKSQSPLESFKTSVTTVIIEPLPKHLRNDEPVKTTTRRKIITRAAAKKKIIPSNYDAIEEANSPVSTQNFGTDKRPIIVTRTLTQLQKTDTQHYDEINVGSVNNKENQDPTTSQTNLKAKDVVTTSKKPGTKRNTKAAPKNSNRNKRENVELDLVCERNTMEGNKQTTYKKAAIKKKTKAAPKIHSDCNKIGSSENVELGYQTSSFHELLVREKNDAFDALLSSMTNTLEGNKETPKRNKKKRPSPKRNTQPVKPKRLHNSKVPRMDLMMRNISKNASYESIFEDNEVSKLTSTPKYTKKSSPVQDKYLTSCSSSVFSDLLIEKVAPHKPVEYRLTDSEDDKIQPITVAEQENFVSNVAMEQAQNLENDNVASILNQSVVTERLEHTEINSEESTINTTAYPFFNQDHNFSKQLTGINQTITKSASQIINKEQLHLQPLNSEYKDELINSWIATGLPQNATEVLKQNTEAILHSCAINVRGILELLRGPLDQNLISIYDTLLVLDQEITNYFQKQ